MALPTDLDLITLKGKYVDLQGNEVAGRITFDMSNYLTSGAEDLVVVPRQLSVTLVAGAFTVQLPATDDPHITGDPFVYQVTEEFEGLSGRTYNISLPFDITQPVELSDLAPASTPQSGIAYLTIAAGDERYIHLSSNVKYGFLPLALGEPVPADTPSGTMIVRT